MLHATQLEYCFITRDIYWPRNFSSWRYQVATMIIWFTTIGLFSLWGSAKDCVYADKPSTLDHLKSNIRHVMAEISPKMCEKFVECLQHFTWKSFKWYSTSHIMSTFKLYNEKRNTMKNYFLFVLFMLTFETTKYGTRYLK